MPMKATLHGGRNAKGNLFRFRCEPRPIAAFQLQRYEKGLKAAKICARIFRLCLLFFLIPPRRRCESGRDARWKRQFGEMEAAV